MKAIDDFDNAMVNVFEFVFSNGAVKLPTLAYRQRLSPAEGKAA